MAKKRNLQQNSRRKSPPLQLDFVHVGGRYRVGKLLGSGGSGKPNSDTGLRCFLSSLLGSVYLGRDIRMGAEVTMKIGHADRSPSRLNHEYNMYKSTIGSIGISSVL
jgi:hypothetical protein